MKKKITLLFLLVYMITLVGCNKGVDTMYQLGIVVDGVFYEKSYQPMPAEVDDSAITGHISSYTDTYPKKDGQTNISKDLIDAPYAKVEGGIAILYQNEWYLCTVDNGEPFVVKTYEVTTSENAFEDDELVIFVKHYEMSDGTWKTDDYTYQYRLVITGRMPNAVKDTTYVFLSNIEEISFQKAMMASGLSSNLEDYFDKEVAKFVGMK